MSLTLDDWKNIATIIGGVVALFALIKGVYEYIKQGAQKRAEQFFEMRNRFKDKDSFKEIADLTELDDPKLKEIPFKEKRDYLGFMEEIAISVNSKLIKPEIAHYMFGYYAIKCWKSRNFWSDINRDSLYWIVFKTFVEKMQEIEKNFEYDEKRMRF
ncbi:MAG: hypothetical protein LUM44_09395 [Pyrinomonadaceae bacterium]|nr:hypothetical protein [Pyrinomonadaceae bacterium]